MTDLKRGAGGLLAVVSFAVLAVGCVQATPAPPPPAPPPRILTFAPSAAEVSRGDMVTFSYAVDVETTVTSAVVQDQLGRNLTATLDPSTGQGSLTLPMQVTSVLVLRVDGPGGRDVAFARVAVRPSVSDAFLLAVPERARPGERVDLVWTAEGADSGELRAAGQATVLAQGTTGTLTINPTRTVSYRLTLRRGEETVTRDVTVLVPPQIDSLDVTPPAARRGQLITVSWRTAGAEAVSLSERTLGNLFTAGDGGAVSQGSFTFTVPTGVVDAGVLPDGGAAPVPDGGDVQVLPDGFPLRFVLTASTRARDGIPAQEVTREAGARVGEGPSIDEFLVPAWVTAGRPLTVSWKTSGAVRVELRSGSAILYQPPVNQQVDGQLTLAAVSAESTLEFIAYDFTGASVSERRTVRVDQLPAITSCTLPPTVPSIGTAAMLQWAGTNADRLVLRSAQGPTAFTRQAASGSATVNVPASQTFTCELYNRACDVTTSPLNVAVTTAVTGRASPDLVGAGNPVRFTWDIGLAPVEALTGFPGAEVQYDRNAANFQDITALTGARRLPFGGLRDRDESVTTFQVPCGFRFPFLGGLHDRFTVSTNGFVALGVTGSQPVNADLEATGAAYSGVPLLAPFWDDLDLGADGSVWWWVDEVASPRKLYIQWTNVAKVGTAGTRLSFEVVLSESGEVAFQYGELVGPESNGNSATVGLVAPGGLFSVLCVGGGTRTCDLTSNSTAEFLRTASPPTTGSFGLTPDRPVLLGFYATLVGGAQVPLYDLARVFKAGDVVVNEALPIPVESRPNPDGGADLPGAPGGQFLEFYNSTSQPLDLGGLRVRSLAQVDGGFTFPPGFVVPAGAHALAVQSLDPGENGGLPQDAGPVLVWPAGYSLSGIGDIVDLTVPPAGTAPGLLVSTLGWQLAGSTTSGLTSSEGQSVQPGEQVIATGSVVPSCPRRVRYGAAQMLGTPGELNEGCFEYTVTPIGAEFEDISATGQALVPSTFSNTSTWASSSSFPSGHAIEPFPYFGTVFTQLWVSQLGVVQFGPTSSFTSTANASAPTTVSNTVAVFWDSLRREPGRSQLYLERRADRTIVQWHRMNTGFQSSSVGGSEDLTFQVKLFDDGVLEYHYADMLGTALATGTSATVWLERPNRSAALWLLRNAATGPGLISSRTAYRFTPRAR